MSDQLKCPRRTVSEADVLRVCGLSLANEADKHTFQEMKTNAASGVDKLLSSQMLAQPQSDQRLVSGTANTGYILKEADMRNAAARIINSSRDEVRDAYRRANGPNDDGSNFAIRSLLWLEMTKRGIFHPAKC